MKVYQVVMSYFDGDHEHGSYKSPLFAKRQDAINFRQAILALDDNDEQKWWTDSMYSLEDLIYVDCLTVHDHWDGVLPKLRDVLDITYT